MPLAGKSFVAEKIVEAMLPICVKSANTSDALVEILANEKGLTVKQVLKNKESHRPDLITLGDNLSKGGNLAMHYIAKGAQVLTGIRRVEELNAIKDIKNLDILVVYVVSDTLALPDNLTITPSDCDFVLFNPRMEVPDFSKNLEFKRIVDFLMPCK